MGKIIIENIPNAVLDEVQSFLQAIVNDDMSSMLENAGYGHEAYHTDKWNLHSQAEPVTIDGFYEDHVIYGGGKYPLVEVEVPVPARIGSGTITYLLTSETLIEAMGGPEALENSEYEIDSKIFYYVDLETWKTRGNMTNEDWVEYIQNEQK